MSDPLRPTAHTVELIDVEVEPPFNGQRVFGLGLGGCLAPLVWNSNSHLYFVAWMPYPKAPDSVKQRLAQRRPSVNAVNPKEDHD